MDQSDARAMRLVHLSDLHLGYRQYQRQTQLGINQREADVAASLQRVIDKVIELRPDLILIGGDVFHTVRPPNPAIVHAYLQLSRLVRMLPESTVVMVAGNHDTPLTSETRSILQLFTALGINVVEREAKRITLHEHDLSILAVPELPLLPV
ncbi:MAG: metallophosphoesterase, partial [Gemmatimonadota bacterium]|nr:metallophosphoesterase [Gemmatimonadota bacterium]